MCLCIYFIGEDMIIKPDLHLDMEYKHVLRVEKVYINSAILAANSPFFYKVSWIQLNTRPDNKILNINIFSAFLKWHEGISPTTCYSLCLWIRYILLHLFLSFNIHDLIFFSFTVTEEDALIDILRYIYTGKLTSTSASELLTVLIIADRFEVFSCMGYCSRLLCKLPMTLEFAINSLELPCSVSIATSVQPLIDAAKEYLVDRYMNILKYVYMQKYRTRYFLTHSFVLFYLFRFTQLTPSKNILNFRCQDELMELPLAAIQSILSSDDLYVASEDVLYDVIVKWVRLKYPIVAERRQVFCTYLCPLIRFPMMSCRKLKKVLRCSELFSEFATKVVLEALFFKADAPHKQRALAQAETLSHRFIERGYKYRPVKIVEFQSPLKQCIVYLNLHRSECSKLFPSGRIYSQAFHIDGQAFFLSAHCNMDQENMFHCFGLFIGMQDKNASALTVDYEFAARTKEEDHEDFVSKYKGYYTFTGGKAVGYRNLFTTQWSKFLSEDSPYFINDVVHLRAELTIKRP